MTKQVMVLLVLIMQSRIIALNEEKGNDELVSRCERLEKRFGENENRFIAILDQLKISIAADPSLLDKEPGACLLFYQKLLENTKISQADLASIKQEIKQNEKRGNQ